MQLEGEESREGEEKDRRSSLLGEDMWYYKESRECGEWSLNSGAGVRGEVPKVLGQLGLLNGRLVEERERFLFASTPFFQ
jgi:hypothetical protein